MYIAKIGSGHSFGDMMSALQPVNLLTKLRYEITLKRKNSLMYALSLDTGMTG